MDKIGAIAKWITTTYQHADNTGFDVTGITVKKTDERGIQLDGFLGAAASGVKFTPQDADAAVPANGTECTLVVDPLAVHTSRDGGTGTLKVPAYLLANDGSADIFGTVLLAYNGCRSAILGKTKRGGKTRVILAASADTTKRADAIRAELAKRAAASAAK